MSSNAWANVPSCLLMRKLVVWLCFEVVVICFQGHKSSIHRSDTLEALQRRRGINCHLTPESMSSCWYPPPHTHSLGRVGREIPRVNSGLHVTACSPSEGGSLSCFQAEVAQRGLVQKVYQGLCNQTLPQKVGKFLCSGYPNSTSTYHIGGYTCALRWLLHGSLLVCIRLLLINPKKSHSTKKEKKKHWRRCTWLLSFVFSYKAWETSPTSWSHFSASFLYRGRGEQLSSTLCTRTSCLSALLGMFVWGIATVADMSWLYWRSWCQLIVRMYSCMTPAVVLG